MFKAIRLFFTRLRFRWTTWRMARSFRKGLRMHAKVADERK